MANAETVEWPREGYSPEWLAVSTELVFFAFVIDHRDS